MSVSAYQANKMLDRQFGNVSYTVSTTLYIGLSTTPVNFDGTGGTEPVGNAYARVAVTNDKTSWSTAAIGVLTNLISFTFPESTGSWGTVTYVVVYDASTAGNVLFYEALPVSRAVPTATTVLFVASAFTVQMNNT